jgi:hypothetical protein
MQLCDILIKLRYTGSIVCSILNYIDYEIRCVAAKGEGAPECDKFSKYYRSLCPGEWVCISCFHHFMYPLFLLPVAVSILVKLAFVA